MVIDKTTLSDLSIFNAEEEFSVFEKLNLTRTTGGRDRLRKYFTHTLPNIQAIENVQNTLRLIIEQEKEWPAKISNGSIMMIHKFYETGVDSPPARPTLATAHYYRLFHPADFSLIKDAVDHAFNFLKGMQHLVTIFLHEDAPENLKVILNKANALLNKSSLGIISKKESSGELLTTELLSLSHFLVYHYKNQIFQLIELYYHLDAWYGMAMSVKKYDLHFPAFNHSKEPVLKADKLYHILLEKPVAYDVELNRDNSFIFLTGANMAGKSTFIKAVGTAVFMAHIGMGVPASSMELSEFEGLLSNINVMDNIVKGESFFYNEVQRIKNTILKVSDGRKWLILIDELFKGTNVQDAMKCSTVVIEGLIRIKHSLFILSTHLYEIGEDLKKYPNIDFKYFETSVSDGELEFSYQLKDGVSNDRLGYLILEREGVIELLDGL